MSANVENKPAGAIALRLCLHAHYLERAAELIATVAEGLREDPSPEAFKLAAEALRDASKRGVEILLDVAAEAGHLKEQTECRGACAGIVDSTHA